MKYLKVERSGTLAYITLDRPEQRNAISDPADCAEVVQTIGELNGDNGLRAIILTGAGESFCAGGNLKNMRTGSAMGRGNSPVTTRSNYRLGIQTIPQAMAALEVPLIAAINGPAVGAGCDLACMADIRIASEKAKFGSTFIRLGLVPGDGGAWLLQRAVGYSKAAELAFTGATINAEQALRIGLVSEVTPHEQLMPAAIRLAQTIAQQPAQALRLTKRLLREAQHQRLSDILELSAAFQALVQEEPDHMEAVAAALEKRKPVFQGD